MPERVLIIDDEAPIAMAIAVRLEAAGFETTQAPDGPSGLTAARARKPDAIILDLRMPGMDGFAVLAALAADPDLADIPVIVVSANATEATRNRALDAGAAAFFAKPFDAPELVEAIRGALSRSEKPKKEHEHA